MITRMEVVPPQSSVPALSLGGFMPNDEVIQIRNIDGLGPVKSEIASTPFATGRGDLFQGSSTSKRNIVLNLGLNPDWADQTMTSLRQQLYRYFMPESWATLRFYSDELPVVYIRGVVEGFEPNLFSQDPEMQISLICPKPDFIDVETTLRSGPVGSPAAIDYIGTVPTGFELRVNAGSYLGGLTIINETPAGGQRLSVSGVTVNSGLYFELNTTRSQRYVYNVIAGTDDVVNILAKMSKDSDWPELAPGENHLSVNADTSGVTWTLAYFNRFGGL